MTEGTKDGDLIPVLGMFLERTYKRCATGETYRWEITTMKPDYTYLDTGDQIRAARALLNWKQRELAHNAHLSISTIRRLEHEETIRCSPYTLRHLAEVFSENDIVFLKHGAQRITKGCLPKKAYLQRGGGGIILNYRKRR